MTCSDQCVCVCAQHMSTICAEILYLISNSIGIPIPMSLHKPGRAPDFVTSRSVFPNRVLQTHPAVHIQTLPNQTHQIEFFGSFTLR